MNMLSARRWLYLSRALGIESYMTIGEDTHHASVVVALHDDDPEVLRSCLRSLVFQTRRPQAIHIIDSGSCQHTYVSLREWFVPFAQKHNIAVYWTRQEYEGLRGAHALAFEQAVFATIFITVSASVVLDIHAVEELIAPFSDDSIHGVTGLALLHNNQRSLRARFIDLLYVSEQFTTYSHAEPMASEGVVAYRASTVRANLASYLNDTHFDEDIEICDDSILMVYALHEGQVVQRPSALFFTRVPESMNYHLDAQVRWAKRFLIRYWWRQKKLPEYMKGFLYQMRRAFVFMLPFLFIPALLIYQPDIAFELIMLIAIATGIYAYIISVRYFSVRRADQTFISRLLTYLVAPGAIIWSVLILRPLKLYAIVSVLLSPRQKSVYANCHLHSLHTRRHLRTSVYK